MYIEENNKIFCFLKKTKTKEQKNKYYTYTQNNLELKLPFNILMKILVNIIFKKEKSSVMIEKEKKICNYF